MSANLFMEYTGRNGQWYRKELPIALPNKFMANLRELADYDYPWNLRPIDVPVLETLATICREDKKSIAVLIATVKKHGEVRLDAEF